MKPNELHNLAKRAVHFADDFKELKSIAEFYSDFDINYNDGELLCEASRKGFIEIVKCLITLGADVNIDNDAAIRGAALGGRLEVIKYLVEHGANIHADNDAPLRYAIHDCMYDIVAYLIGQMDPKYVIRKWNKLAKYITDPKYSQVKFVSKFGILNEDNS